MREVIIRSSIRGGSSGVLAILVLELDYACMFYKAIKSFLNVELILSIYVYFFIHVLLC